MLRSAPDGPQDALYVAREDRLTFRVVEPREFANVAHRGGVTHLEGIVAAQDHAVDAYPAHQILQSQGVVDEGVEIDQAQRLEGILTTGDRKRAVRVGAADPPQLVGEETTTVHRAHLQSGVAFQHSAVEQVSEGDGRLGGVAHTVGGEVPAQSASGQRRQRMEQDQAAQLLGPRPEGFQGGVVQFGAVDRGGDLDTGHTELHHRVTELVSGPARVLQRHGRQSTEPIGVLADRVGQRLVVHPRVSTALVRCQSVGREINEAGEQLHSHPGFVHGREAGLDITQVDAQWSRDRILGDARPGGFIENLHPEMPSPRAQSAHDGRRNTVAVDVDRHPHSRASQSFAAVVEATIAVTAGLAPSRHWPLDMEVGTRLGKSANRSSPLRASVTLRDVAREAEVHPSTASRALNDATRTMVNSETVTRVSQAAARLGYLPDTLARGLKMKRTFTVGMLIPDLTNPLFPPIARGIEDTLGKAGYTLVLASTDDDPDKERSLAEVMLNRRVDGLILATARRDYQLAEHLVSSGLPVVLVNRTMDNAPAPAVIGDDHAGMGLAVRHLAELGHTRIAHVSGPRTLSTGLTRYQSFKSWMHNLDLEPGDDLIVPAELFQEAPGAKSFSTLLDSGADFTAVVAGNDLIALGCYDAMRERGLRVPTDISVVGYNDTPFSDKLNPPLTTVHIPHYQLGVKSAELLIEGIAKPDEPAVSVLLRPTLALRESTAPPA